MAFADVHDKRARLQYTRKHDTRRRIKCELPQDNSSKPFRRPDLKDQTRLASRTTQPQPRLETSTYPRRRPHPRHRRANTHRSLNIGHNKQTHQPHNMTLQPAASSTNQAPFPNLGLRDSINPPLRNLSDGKVVLAQ